MRRHHAIAPQRTLPVFYSLSPHPPYNSEDVREKLKKARAELKRRAEEEYKDPAKAAEAK